MVHSHTLLFRNLLPIDIDSSTECTAHGSAADLATIESAAAGCALLNLLFINSSSDCAAAVGQQLCSWLCSWLCG